HLAPCARRVARRCASATGVGPSCRDVARAASLLSATSIAGAALGSGRRTMTTGSDHGIDSTGSSLSISDALASPVGTAASRREQEIRTELASHPQALQALDRLAANLDCYVLSDAQRVQALDDFMAAPNAATAAWVEGRIAQTLGVDPARAHTLVSPDAGTQIGRASCRERG